MFNARAALAVLTLGLCSAGPAPAQVGPDATVYIFGAPDRDRTEYGRPRRPPPPDADDDRPLRPLRPLDDVDDRLPPPWFDEGDRLRFRERYREMQPRWGDSVCVTRRGSCMTPAGPSDARCSCRIPGFGFARGRIAD